MWMGSIVRIYREMKIVVRVMPVNRRTSPRIRIAECRFHWGHRSGRVFSTLPGETGTMTGGETIGTIITNREGRLLLLLPDRRCLQLWNIFLDWTHNMVGIRHHTK